MSELREGLETRGLGQFSTAMSCSKPAAYASSLSREIANTSSDIRHDEPFA